MKEPKWDTISVPSASLYGGDGLTIRYREFPKGTLAVEKKVTRDLDLDYLSPDEAIRQIQENSDGISEAMISVDRVYGYGDDVSFRTAVTGWSDEATYADLQKAMEYKQAQVVASREHAERQIASLRASYPELL